MALSNSPIGTGSKQDVITFLSGDATGAITQGIKAGADAENARFVTAINAYVRELYEQGGNRAIDAWAPFLESTARSQNSTLAALQRGGQITSQVLERLPSIDVLGKFKLGPLDALFAGAAIYNDYREGNNWRSEFLKQVVSAVAGGFASAAAAGVVAGATGVAATAAAPVLVGGLVAVGVGLAIGAGWDYVEDNWGNITNWTDTQVNKTIDALNRTQTEIGNIIEAQKQRVLDQAREAAEAFSNWADDAANTLRDMADYARQNVAQLGEDLAQFYEQARDAAQAAADQAKAELGNLIDQARNAAQEFWDGAKNWANDTMQHARDAVRDFASATDDWMDDLLDDLGDLTEALGDGLADALERLDPGAWFKGDMGDLMDRLKRAFDDAENTRSPLILDLDGDGVETSGQMSQVYFDHDNNGFAERTGWVGPHDGLLVLDRNGDGQINNGGELFGDHTALPGGQEAENGFVALAALDSNADGRIDAGDTAFAQLRVWRDANGNAKVDAGELLTLAAAGVERLSLAHSGGTEVDADGNSHLQIGSYLTTGGQTRTMTDVWFAVNTAHTIDIAEVAVSAEVAALPDLDGSGEVGSLHQAMMRDTSGALRAIVARYVAETDTALRGEMVVEIIYRWAGVFDVDPLSRAATQIYGNVIGDARKLESLEAFLGEDYVGIWCWGELDANPHGPAAAVLLKAFNKLVDFVSASLEAQVSFSDLFDLIELKWNATTSILEPEVSQLVAELLRRYALDANATSQLLLDFAAAMNTVGPAGGAVLAAMREYGDPVGAGLLPLLSTVGANSTIGTAGDDWIDGTEAGDLMLGLAGNDVLAGYIGDDTLVGGLGNDLMTGGDGSDTYRFARGGGQDTIDNQYAESTAAAADVLIFGEGIAATEIEVSRYYYDVILTIAGTTDSVTIFGYLDQTASTGAAIDEIRFADGTVWTVADVVLRLNRVTEGQDFLIGSTGADSLDGLGGDDQLELGDGNDTGRGGDGNDWIYGGAGGDSLEGGAGDDLLYGDDGDDTLDGGTDSDRLEGGAGNDVYLFRPNWGYDTVESYDYVYDPVLGGPVPSPDVIRFAAGTAPADLIVRREGSDLMLLHVNGNDTVRISFHFGGATSAIDRVEFADGTIWSEADLQRMAAAGTAGYDYLVGTEGADLLSGLGGDDYILGEAGDDTLDGGAGDDELYGGDGADTYRFAAGWGSDAILNYDYDVDPTTYEPLYLPDAIAFGAGILAAEISVRREGDDLLLRHVNGIDQIRVYSQFSGAVYGVDTVRFADGTVWTSAMLEAMSRNGTPLADDIYGTDGNDTLAGLAGSDSIHGGAGDDDLSGGLDDDWLDGGAGSDIYRFGPGWGQDNIWNYDWDDSGLPTTDVIAFRAGVAPGDLVVRNAYGNLFLRHVNGTDSIWVQSHFLGPDYAIQEVHFADGTVWTEADLLAASRLGSALDDELTGDTGPDLLEGLAGNDQLSGGEGNDTLRGGEGADTLYGGDGGDSVDGGSGDDYVYGEAGDDTVRGGAGDDVIGGGDGSDSYMFGLGWGADTIDNYDVNYEGPAWPDRVYFAADVAPADLQVRRSGSDLMLSHVNGADRITISNYFYGVDYQIDEIRFADGTIWGAAALRVMALRGSSGDDYLDGYETGDSLRGEDGNDALSGNAGNDSLIGGAGLDSLYGGDGADSLEGGADDDYLYGGEGDDILRGGLGNDWLSGDDGNDSYLMGLGWGQDSVSAYDYSYDPAVIWTDRVIFGANVAAGDIALRREASDLLLRHANGTDSLRISGHFYGVDSALDEVRFADGRIWTAAAFDLVRDLEYVDVKIGGDGNDRLNGGDDADFIGGGAGNDVVQGRGGDDTLYGGWGDDTVTGGAGADQIHGSNGRDALYGEEDDDSIDGDAGDDFIGGGAGNDTIRGGDGADTIYAGLGDDNVGGGAGNDQIYGSAGANVIYAGQGDDTVQGGTGSDTIYGSAGRNQLFGNDGVDVIYTSAGGDLAAGGAGNDTVLGAEGNDTIYAGLGNDFIGGGAGNDLIILGAGANRAFGGVGNDTVHAGVGRDVISGGPGADVFVFASAAAIGIGAARDVITDFTAGVDHIDLRALGTSFNGSAGLAGGGAKSFFYFAAGGLVIGDQNGDRVADWVLEVTGGPPLSAGDFLL